MSPSFLQVRGVRQIPAAFRWRRCSARPRPPSTSSASPARHVWTQCPTTWLLPPSSPPQPFSRLEPVPALLLLLLVNFDPLLWWHHWWRIKPTKALQECCYYDWTSNRLIGHSSRLCSKCILVYKGSRACILCSFTFIFLTRQNHIHLKGRFITLITHILVQFQLPQLSVLSTMCFEMQDIYWVSQLGNKYEI